MKKKSHNISVGVIEPVGGHGGMDYYDLGLCRGLKRAGVNVSLFTCDKTIMPNAHEFPIYHKYLHIYGNKNKLLRLFNYLLGSFLAVLSCVANRHTVCHFHWFHVGPLELYNLVLAKLFRRKIVVTAHDVESFACDQSISIIAQFCYRRCDAIVAHNNVSKKELVDKVNIARSKIKIIPHGSYLGSIIEMQSKSFAREKLNITKNAKVLLFFGQIKDVKGLDVLLEAMPKIIEEVPDAILLIAGKVWKTDFLKYQAIIEKHSLESHCRTDIRYIPDNEIAAYYGAADLVVLPYKKIYQSGVLLMAMSFNRPVMVSNLPGMLEVVTPAETGLIFESGNSAKLSEEVVKALKSEALLDGIASKAISMMENKYDWSKIGISTARVYRGL